MLITLFLKYSQEYCTGYDNYTAVTLVKQSAIVIRPAAEIDKAKWNGAEDYAANKHFLKQTLYHETGHTEFNARIGELDTWLKNMGKNNKDVLAMSKDDGRLEKFANRASESYGDAYGLLLLRKRDGLGDKEWRGVVEDLIAARQMTVPEVNTVMDGLRAGYTILGKGVMSVKFDDHNDSEMLKKMLKIDPREIDRLSPSEIREFAMSLAVNEGLSAAGVRNVEYPFLRKSIPIGKAADVKDNPAIERKNGLSH